MTIQVVCAWCGKPMGTKPGNADLPVSHSICPDCVEKARSEMEYNSNSLKQRKDASCHA